MEVGPGSAVVQVRRVWAASAPGGCQVIEMVRCRMLWCWQP
jgi:hypothetical protein